MSLVWSRRVFLVVAFTLTAAFNAYSQSQQFTIEQVRSYPFPNELTASLTGSRIAWAFNEQGQRNVWVAEGPEFRARRLTNYTVDDGQELTSVSISPDGKFVIYVRGGEHSANWQEVPPDPALIPVAQKIQLWSVPFAGGQPKLLSEGDNPEISPKGDRIAFVKERAIWIVPIDGSAEAKRMFYARGESGSPQWSPDGNRLAFVSGRGDHSFIGIYTNEATPILYLAPSTSRDTSPRWSPDGKRVAFVRRPGAGGAPEPILEDQPEPWSIWSADATTGEGRLLWKSPQTLRGSIPSTQGGTNLHWAANARIVFLSYMDGWPHLYSIPENGGEPMLLTPGRYMAEYIQISPDRRYMVFAANAGTDANDIDRRHVVKVPVDKALPQVMTPGSGLEWTPVVTGDGQSLVFISATTSRSPLPAVMPMNGGTARLLAEDRIPANYPTAQLVTPRKVVFKSPDGAEVHGQLFERQGGETKKPAIVFVHGGPPRQMLLGWHYSDYYANNYALNQYLASRGFVVLSVNYRLGIGYGYEFHNPKDGGPRGASEYQDVKAAAEYLRTLPQVDTKRIGIYGGSYGGFLTAMALAHNSDLFAAGVDIHGVHDWMVQSGRSLLETRYEKAPDTQQALDLAWKSSPISALNGWKSPVLLIHGDDDRNVRFSQTVDLVQRLEKTGVHFEELVIPDDTHHFMRYANWLKVDSAAAAFFEKVFHPSTR